jgi:hypothetical protein
MVARDGSGASSGKRHFVIVSEPDPKDAPVENDALNAGLKAFNHVPGRYNLGGRYTSRRIAPVDEDDADVDDEDTDEGQDDPTDEDDDGEDDEDYDSDEDVGMADGEDDEDYDSDEDVGMADGEDEGPEKVSVNDHLHFHFAPLSLFPCSFPPLVPQRPRLPCEAKHPHPHFLVLASSPHKEHPPTPYPIRPCYGLVRSRSMSLFLPSLSHHS